MARRPALDERPDDALALARARRELLVWRLPRFAFAWLILAVAWSVILHLEGLVAPPLIVALPLLHAGMLGAATAIARRQPDGAYVVPLVVVTCALLGVTATVLFAAVDASAGFALFVLLLLSLLASLMFAWGWRAQLGLLAFTFGAWLLATPWFRFYAPPGELVAAILTGCAVSFAVAEGAARAFTVAYRHRAAEERGRAALEASRNEYRDLAEQAHEPIFTIDPGGRLTYANPAMATMLGEDSGALVGRSILEFLTAHPANGALRALVERRTGGMLERLEFEVQTPYGPRWLETEPSQVRNHAEAPARIRAICRDVTARKSVERERDAMMAAEQTARFAAERARREAEEAAGARGRFLAVLSHELSSPVQSLLNWTRLLQRHRVPPGQMPQVIEAVDANARTIARLLEDMQDLARIDAGKVSLQLEQLDVRALVAERVEAVRAAAAEKGVTLETQVAPVAGLVRGDATRLGQVLANLLANAVKFTGPGGRVTVSLGRANGEIELTVRDTGIGIPPEALPHLFEEFRQAGESVTRRYGGLGLGLAIARRLVELHGGRITAESEGPDKGATFRVRLPAANHMAARSG